LIIKIIERLIKTASLITACILSTLQKVERTHSDKIQHLDILARRVGSHSFLFTYTYCWFD